MGAGLAQVTGITQRMTRSQSCARWQGASAGWPSWGRSPVASTAAAQGVGEGGRDEQGCRGGPAASFLPAVTVPLGGHSPVILDTLLGVHL